jgi:hypothetical protein
MNNLLRENVANWLKAQTPPSSAELSARIRQTEGDLVEIQGFITSIYGLIAQQPSRSDLARGLLDHLLGERLKLQVALGESLLEWRLQGGKLDLRAPGETHAERSRQPEEEPEDLAPEDESGKGEGVEAPGSPPSGAVPEPRSVEARPVEARPSASVPEPEVASVSADVIKAWQEQMRLRQVPTPKPQEHHPSEARQRATLQSLVNAMGELRDLSTMVSIIDEVDALELITSDERRAHWPQLSKPVQRVWLAALVARTRAVKDATMGNPGVREQLKRIILHYPVFAKTHQPGYVNGLQVVHSPEHGSSWRDDAAHFWAQLKAFLVEPPAPSAPVSAPVPEVEAPEPASQESASPQPAEEEEEVESSPLGEDWPIWPQIRNKSVVLLGGEPREQARAKLEQVFELSDLEWIPGDNPRRLDAVVERVTRSKIDVVLVLQNWTAHKVTNKLVDACKSSKVPWALISGYSITAVRHGLERFLGAPTG